MNVTYLFALGQAPKMTRRNIVEDFKAALEQFRETSADLGPAQVDMTRRTRILSVSKAPSADCFPVPA
jgi:hypothetical protein